MRHDISLCDADLDGLNLLIADDEELNYRLMTAYLGTSGASLFYAKNGRIAVEICRLNPIHLVLMDIRMPEMNGIEAARIIKEFSDIPIIAVSAHYKTDFEIMENDLSWFDHYIQKPVLASDLYFHILRLINPPMKQG